MRFRKRYVKDFKKVIFLLGGGLLIFFLISQPAILWLPFARDFPSWLTERPLLSYFTDFIYIGFYLLLLSLAAFLFYYFYKEVLK